MTNTSFRKKALLSSVAMMLVALIALGSATFAWFATNPKVSTAESVHMTTTASTGILIMSKTEHDKYAEALATDGSALKTAATAAEKTIIDYYAKEGIVLNAKYTGSLDKTTFTGVRSTDLATDSEQIQITQPIIPEIISSSETANNYATGSVWWKIKGQTADTGALDTSDAWGSLSLSQPSNCYKEDIYIITGPGASSESVKSAKVTWTQGSTAIAPSMRVALLNATGDILGIWAPTGSTIKMYDGSQTGDTAAATVAAKEVAVSTTWPTAVNGDELTFAAGKQVTVSNNTDMGAKVTVVVYLDGSDSTANSTNASAASASDIMSSLKIDLSI